MKVIFLDIDGVLNKIGKPSESTFFRLGKHIEPEIMKLFNEVLEKIDVNIVISSSWREDMDDLKEILLEAGFSHWNRVIGHTPINYSFRGEQIKEFLDSSQIKKYLVIDDCIADICIDIKAIPEEFVIKSDPRNGLSLNEFKKIEEFFKEKK